MRKAPVIALQLSAVWLLGAAILPTAVRLLALSTFGGIGAVVIAALACAAIVAAYLWLVIGMTAQVSFLGATAARRALWVLLMFGFGTALWWLGWAVSDEAELGISTSGPLTLVLGGVPFALVAEMLLFGRILRLTAVAALVGIAAFGLIALKQSGPDEVTLRLQYVGRDRATAFVVEIPGYRPVDNAYGDRLGADTFVPYNPDAIPPKRYVTIVAQETTVAPGGKCGEAVLDDSTLATAECTVEPDGLVYRRGVLEHGYQVRRGDVVVVVAGTLAVDRELLRNAALTLRPASAAELPTVEQTGRYFVADVPGYRAAPTGMPPGVSYKPADPSAEPRSVYISLHAVRASFEDFEDVCFRAECVSESDGLTYVRGEDTHGYVLRRGDVNVHAMGGVSVDRALLRQVALTARPATDAELLRALPPVPSASWLQRLRSWLREHT